MIDFTPLKNTGEKLVALFLAVSPQPLRQCEIADILCISVSHCREHLKRLASIGVVETLQERRDTFYRFSCSADRPIGADDRPIGAGDRPIGADDRPIGAGDRPIGAGDRPIGAVDFPENTRQLTNIDNTTNEIEQTNKKGKGKGGKRGSNIGVGSLSTADGSMTAGSGGSPSPAADPLRYPSHPHTAPQTHAAGPSRAHTPRLVKIDPDWNDGVDHGFQRSDTD